MKSWILVYLTTRYYCGKSVCKKKKIMTWLIKWKTKFQTIIIVIVHVEALIAVISDKLLFHTKIIIIKIRFSTHMKEWFTQRICWFLWTRHILKLISNGTAHKNSMRLWATNHIKATKFYLQPRGHQKAMNPGYNREHFTPDRFQIL